MALATILYLIYLFTPIVLLLVGSFGQTWFNTLLPSGFTLDWYLQVASDGSFRRAFWTSLQVCLLTCIVCAVVGTPLAYAIYRAASRKKSVPQLALSIYCRSRFRRSFSRSDLFWSFRPTSFRSWAPCGCSSEATSF